MKRVFFYETTDYKKTTPHTSDPSFIPLSVKNDIKAQKNGTKKTVYWVRKKQREEDGTVKGETWTTSQQYIGDWKKNRKDGYGIKIYDNKDKYEGNWNNGLRHGKGTYWVCLGKTQYRKLYTGDWCENKKDGQGIYFYNDASCYDGTWKNSKRDGKGLMIYANGDIYEGAWQNDLKHGYGILEKKPGDKYYGYWDDGLKEGQGYYYYSSTGKIYLGEWHEDVPRCGIFTDVSDENIKREFKKHFKAEDAQPLIPGLKLDSPENILEDSIRSVHFIRLVKLARSKTLHELFPIEIHAELIGIFTLKTYAVEDQGGDHLAKLPDNMITVKDFKSVCHEKLGQENIDQTLELIFFIFELSLSEETKLDFLLFARLFYLMSSRNSEPEGQVELINANGDEEDVSGFADDKLKEIEMLTNDIKEENLEDKKNYFEYSVDKDDREYEQDSANYEEMEY